MRIAVLGTGMVGRSLAGGLAASGHEVVIGTRDPAQTATRQVGDGTFADWLAGTPGVDLDTSAGAATRGEVVINATSGEASVAALTLAGEANLAGKVVVDVANPLDFSGGFPPTLSVCNTDSLAEQIQRTFPAAKVVKSLNTVNADVMIDPAGLGDGDSTMFVAGDDAEAKAVVVALLGDLGWRSIVDLGGLDGARALEMYLPLWLRVMQSIDTVNFNIAVIRG